MGKSIVLTRIDNRLVHGQIVGEWAGCVGANLLVIADDDVVKDSVDRSIMKIAADALGLGTRFFTIEETIAKIDKASSSQKILLICRTPSSLRKIIEGGVEIDNVCVGNMHPSEGKKRISDKVYVDKQDISDLKYIQSHVKDFYIQDTPDEEKINYKF